MRGGDVDHMVLYTASWSIHCRQAEQVLGDAGLSYDRKDLSSPVELGGASRDLGIRKLPVLSGDGVYCEGLSAIMEFVNGNGR